MEAACEGAGGVTGASDGNLACTSSSKVLAFTIPLPSLDEQNEIVSYLKEAKASYVYSFFSHKIVSKAEFAQKFSFDLENIFKGKTVEEIVTVLPNYLVKAIEYVTTNIEGI